MRKISKTIILCFVMFFFLCGCQKEGISKEEYLNILANKSGISYSNNSKENLIALSKWNIVTEDDYKELDEILDYEYLSKTLGILSQKNDYFNVLKKDGLIKDCVSKKTAATKQEAIEIIDKVVSSLNSKRIEETRKINKNLNPTSNSFEDIYESYDVGGEFEVDFESSEITPAFDYEKTSYENPKYELLGNKTNAFYTNGYRVSLNYNKSSLTAHISKRIENDFTIYLDLTISDFKTAYKWNYKDKNVKEAYLKVDFSSVEKFGVTKGKNKSYTIDPKNIDSSTFSTFLKTMFNKSNAVDTTIPLCTIKTPIPNVPELYLNFDVFIRMYANGKVELALYNTNEFGFEIIENKLRLIKDVDNDSDLILGGAAKCAVGLNLNLEASKFRLMDIESDFGLRAEAKTTIHFLDEDKEEDSELPFDEIEDISKGNDNIKVCGDVSLNWVLDLKLNSAKTILYKIGLTKTYSFLDEDNQLFNNMRHIENGVFMKSCTVKKSKTTSLKKTQVQSDKIVLSKYSTILNVNEEYALPILKLPSNYEEKDLVYESSNNNVASVQNGLVKAIKKGNTKIKIMTKDKKYEAYFNILVSNK